MNPDAHYSQYRAHTVHTYNMCSTHSMLDINTYSCNTTAPPHAPYMLVAFLHLLELAAATEARYG